MACLEERELDQKGRIEFGRTQQIPLACTAEGFPEGLHRKKCAVCLAGQKPQRNWQCFWRILEQRSSLPLGAVTYRADSSNDQLEEINYNSVEPEITFLLQPQAFHPGSLHTTPS